MTLFNLSNQRFAKQLSKAGQFDEGKHQRDEKGRFSSTGGSSSLGRAATIIGGGVLTGAAIAGARHYLRSLPPGTKVRVVRMLSRNPLLTAMLATAANNARRGYGAHRGSRAIGEAVVNTQMRGSASQAGSLDWLRRALGTSSSASRRRARR